MLVRSRYEFEAAAEAAGLRLTAVRAFSFFCNDPMGIDGPDQGPRRHFHQVRAHTGRLLSADLDAAARRLLVEFLSEIERAALAFCRERLADIYLPSQKLVLLRRTA